MVVFSPQQNRKLLETLQPPSLVLFKKHGCGILSMSNTFPAQKELDSSIMSIAEHPKLLPPEVTDFRISRFRNTCVYLTTISGTEPKSK